MHYYAAPWVGTGHEENGGAFRPPTFQHFSTLDWRGDCTVRDGWNLLAVPARDGDVDDSGAAYLGEDLDDPVAGRLLMRKLGLNPKGGPTVRDAILDLFVEHSTRDGDKTRWNPLAPVLDKRGTARYEVLLGGEKIVDLAVVRGGATYSETFNTADSTTLGPNLTWNELTGNLQVKTNACHVNVGFTNSRARAEHDCATSNNYAQATKNNDTDGNVPIYGLCARYQSGADTCYLGRQNDGGGSASNTDLVKRVTATATVLTTGSHTPAAEVMRVSADGSTIALAFSGVTNLSTTDTGIASGTRCGLVLYGDAGTYDPTFDDFTMGDIATPSIVYQQRGRLRPALLRR